MKVSSREEHEPRRTFADCEVGQPVYAFVDSGSDRISDHHDSADKSPFIRPNRSACERDG
jgi:hypothetical protein